MYPFLILAPVYVFCVLDRIGVTERQMQYYAASLATFVGLCAVLWYATPFAGAWVCGKCRLFDPYAMLAERISETGFRNGTIFSEDEYISGNLRLRFPRARIITMQYPFYVPPLSNDAAQCLVVWNTKRSEPIPAMMVEFMKTRLEYNLAGSEPIRYVTAENRMNHRRLRLGYLFLPDGAGKCR
jgi:hypothetical protein